MFAAKVVGVAVGVPAAAVLSTETGRRTARGTSCAVSCAIDYKYLAYTCPIDATAPEEYAAAKKATDLRVAKRLLWACRENGGIYTKAGQYLATMRNIIPEAFTDTLVVLQDQQPPSPWFVVLDLLEKELGCGVGGIKKVFKEFDTKPIACASIAQVHRAVTHEGKEVAVKIQHPNLISQAAGDVWLLQTASSLVGRLFPGHGYDWLLPEFESTMAMEMDFVQEALNSTRTAAMLRDQRHVVVPAIHWPLTSTRVLTMEFIHGFRIDDQAALQRSNISSKAVAKALLHAHNELLCYHGFFNADPHPGNVMIRPRASMVASTDTGAAGAGAGAAGGVQPKAKCPFGFKKGDTPLPFNHPVVGGSGSGSGGGGAKPVATSTAADDAADADAPTPTNGTASGGGTCPFDITRIFSTAATVASAAVGSAVEPEPAPTLTPTATVAQAAADAGGADAEATPAPSSSSNSSSSGGSHSHGSTDAVPAAMVSTGNAGFDLVLIDHGMYRRLDPTFRRAYCELWCAMATRDHDRGRKAILQFGLDEEHYDLMSVILTNKPSNSNSKFGQRMRWDFTLAPTPNPTPSPSSINTHV